MSIQTHKFLMQYLICFSCKEVLSEPILLPCLHMFCKKCLKEPSCPFCLQSIQIPLEVNYSILLLINHLNQIDDDKFANEYNNLFQFCEKFSIEDKIHFVMMKVIESRDCFNCSSKEKKKRNYKDSKLIYEK